MKPKKQTVDIRKSRIFLRFKTARERLEKQAKEIKKQLNDIDARIKSLTR